MRSALAGFSKLLLQMTLRAKHIMARRPNVCIQSVDLAATKNTLV